MARKEAGSTFSYLPVKIVDHRNKIYASDQKDQLLRYYNYARKRGTMTWLFYLTRDGDEHLLPAMATRRK